jgi:hypothetical protein
MVKYGSKIWVVKAKRRIEAADISENFKTRSLAGCTQSEMK